MKLILTILGSLALGMSFAQKAFVEKKIEKNGTSIGIVIAANDTIHRYAPNCGFKNVTLLSDTTKIRLIGELLRDASDTSLCYAPVVNWANYYKGKKWPVSKRYNTQINALYFINYIALSSKAFAYSPFPVLYDTITHKEISLSSAALNEVVGLYKKWYKTIKGSGFVDYPLPLYGHRYQWFGTLMGNLTFKAYPRWEEYYSCRVVE